MMIENKNTFACIYLILASKFSSQNDTVPQCAKFTLPFFEYMRFEK